MNEGLSDEDKINKEAKLHRNKRNALSWSKST